MSVWDSIAIDDEKKKKKKQSSVWDSLSIEKEESQKPSQIARDEQKEEKIERPKFEFSGELVKQYDGKMVAKEKAVNRYGGLIYGQSMSEPKIYMPKSSLDEILGFKENATNLVDNIRYNQKISTNPMNSNIIRDAERDAERLKNRQEKIQEGLETPKEMSAIEKDFLENVLSPAGQEFYKAGKQFLLRDLPGGIAGAVESQASSIDTETMRAVADWAGGFSDYIAKTRVQNIDEHAPEDLQSFTEGGYKDPRFYARGVGQIVPQYATAIGLSVMTRTPSTGLAFAYEQETGQAFNDLIDRGINPSDARVGANAYGVVATMLEGVNFTKYTNKILGKGTSQEVTNSFKQAFKETLVEGGVDVFKEGATEGAQQFAQNVMTRFYDKNQDLFEGVIDSSVIGALGGIGYVTMDSGNTFKLGAQEVTKQVNQTYTSLKENISLARDIVSGKKQAESELQDLLARQILYKFQEKSKETALKIKDGDTNIIDVQVVKYDENSYGAKADITKEGVSTINQFEGDFKTRAEAIKSILDTVDTSKIQNQNLVNDINNEKSKLRITKEKSKDSNILETDSNIRDIEVLTDSKINIEEKGVFTYINGDKYLTSDINRKREEYNEKFKEIGGKGEITMDDFVDITNKVQNAFSDGQDHNKVFFDELENIKALRGGQIQEKEDNIDITPKEINNGDQQEKISDTQSVSTTENGGSSGEARESVTRRQSGTSTPESGDRSQGDAVKKVGKKTRSKINEDAKKILESKKYSTKKSDYSEQEIKTLLEYSGSGGKESEGASGRGLLDEYYTPLPIVDSMWDIVKKFTTSGKVLEPTVGVGRFFQNAPNGFKLYGKELDKTSGTIAQILYPEANIKIGDFQNLFMDDSGKKLAPKEKYDVVIGNPPYGERSGFLKGMGEESKISRQEDYFIKRGIDLLNKNGVLVYIIPSSFLTKKNYKIWDTIIKAGGKLETAYRLPEGVFEDTSIGTDIVVFRKSGDGKREDFKMQTQNILGKVTERKNRFGKEEEYVAGDKQEAFSMLEKRVEKFSPEVKSEVKIDEKKTKETTESNKNNIKNTETKPKSKDDSKLPANKGNTQKNKNNIEVVDFQVINNNSEIEVEIFEDTDIDGSVNWVSSWAKYLNKYKGKYYHDINYFSGDVREKLQQLEKEKKDLTEAEYKKQKEGLEAVKPKDKVIYDITFDPLDRFVGEIETGNTRGAWTRDGYKQVPTTVLTEFADYVRSLPRNVLSPVIQKEDVIGYARGDRQRAGTKEITGVIKSESKRLYNQFIKTALNPDTQNKIVEKYNIEKNSYVRPEYHKIPVPISGMAKNFRGNPFSLSKTQKNGVGFLVNKGSGLIAYGVGVGKTHTLMTATVANMQKGWTKRPLFIVPGATIEKTWIQTIEQMFPGITINNLEGLQAPVIRRLKKERGDDVKEWIKDGEISIISHDGILKLGFSEDETFELIKDLNDVMGLVKGEQTFREMEKNKNKIKEELGKALKGSTDVKFSDLGIDHISVDEVHNFRKVFQGAKKEDGESGGKRRFANVAGGTPSSRARKLFLLSQAVQKKSGGRNVFLASATPFENHATEVYNILSFMARERLKAMGIFNINDFYSTFANFQSELTQKADGSWDNKEVMKSFSNLPELQRLIQEFIDFKEDPTLVRPDKIVLTPQLKMSEKQQEVRDSIYEMLKSDDDGVVLKASTYAKTNAVSPYFVSEFMDPPKDYIEFVENSPKIQYTLEMIQEIKNNPKTKDKGSFIYIGKEGVSFTNYYIEYLTKKVGYKESEIGVITGEITDTKREDIKEKFNAGEIKVLIGGDPTKEGIDLQKNGYATFNVALGWNPTEMAQVEGRVWRQGNKSNHVLMVYPLVENSGDINIYQKFEEKASRINDLFSYQSKSGVFDVGEVDPKEKKLMLLTDPDQKADLALKLDMQKLEAEKLYLGGEIEALNKTKEKIKNLELTLAGISEKIASYKGDKSEFAVEQLKKYRKEATKTRKNIAAIQEKLKEREISDIQKEINKLNTEIEKIVSKEEKMRGSRESLVEKYRKEYLDNLALTKTMQDHKKDLAKNIDSLYQKTEEELQNEKTRLVKKYSGEASFLDKVKKVDAAKNTDDFKGRIEQLNKFAMSRGIMRKFGGTGTKAAGKFERNSVTTLGEIKLRKDIILDDKTYMSVLAHELAHALEYQITGATNKDTYKVFGENLSPDDIGKIKAELRAVTESMVGKQVAEESPSYYYRDTELFARFMQMFFENPLKLSEIAPYASETLLQNSLNNPIISEYLEAVNGTIDSLQLKLPGFLETGRSLMYDMRQKFQSILGERAGNRAYHTIIRRNQLLARSREVFGKELKKKFKGVKNKELLFRTIEATLTTRKDGTPVFGTRDILVVEDGRIDEYMEAGWQKHEDQENVENGLRMWIQRYTQDQGQRMYEQLNDVEKQIVRDFTVEKEEAKDFFNREVIKERYKVEGEVEGWIHRFWTDGSYGMSTKRNLKNKTASAMKQRKGATGYVEDMQKALYKSLVELENAEVFNDWLKEFFPTVSKPLAPGQKADAGWVEVEGDFIKGLLLAGGRNDYLVTEGGTFKIDKARYQIPEFVYKQFGKIADLSQEAGNIYAVADLVAKFWQVNILAHTGTAMTNFIGGGLQYSLKILSDFYKSILTGDASIVMKDIQSLFDVMTKWNDVPDWMFGGDQSTYYRDIESRRYEGTMGKLHTNFDKAANTVLYPFQLFERYWKKVLAQTSGAFGMTHLNKISKEGLPKLDISDKEALEIIDSVVDLYGLNYENTPMWLQTVSKNPVGKMTLPFKRYIFKYIKMLLNHTSSAFDRNQSWQDRTSKVLGLVTWMGIAMAIYNMGDEDRETPEEVTENTPRWMWPDGKMYLGKTEDNLERFVRIVKYPGFNLVRFGEGNIVGGLQDISEGAATVGPLASVVANQLGWRNQYQLYSSTPQLHAQTAATFVPGYRMLTDIAQILDPFKRYPETPLQEFTRLIPTNDPELLEKYRGKIASNRIPIAKDERVGTRTTMDVPRENYPGDTLLSMLTGIYTYRINPDHVKAFQEREIEKEQETQAKLQKEQQKIDIFERYIEKYNSGEKTFAKGTKLEKQIREELNPETQGEKAEATKIIKEFRVLRDYQNNETVKEIFYAHTIDEKALIFSQLKQEISPEEYRKIVLDLKKKEVISSQLWKEMKDQGLQK